MFIQNKKIAKENIKNLSRNSKTNSLKYKTIEQINNNNINANNNNLNNHSNNIINNKNNSRRRIKKRISCCCFK